MDKKQTSSENNKNEDKIEEILEKAIDDANSSKNEDKSSSEEDIKEIIEEPKEDIKQQFNELNDKYIRAYSDFENTKKRLEKDKYSAIDYAVEKFSKDLLDVLDGLGMAIQAGENKDVKSEDMLKNLTQGVDLTFKKLQKVLEKYGISKIEAKGEFDPNFHNAISKVDSDKHKANEIVEVFQDGYKIKDRVLRASMVSIAN